MYLALCKGWVRLMVKIKVMIIVWLCVRVRVSIMLWVLVRVWVRIMFKL